MRSIPAWAGMFLVAIVVLVVMAWLVRRIEPHLAFFPVPGEDITPGSHGVDYTPLTLTTADGERLHAWRLTRDTPRAYVVYFHGNGGNLSIWSDVYVALWREGFDVLAIDYRGYGLSTGSPSEQGIYRDADAVLDHVMTQPRQPDIPLIYWGRSLGTVTASYAASRKPPNGIVLEAGFPSMRSVLETNPIMWTLSWGSSYRLPTAEWMTDVRQPTLVLHGDRDSVIPYRLGKRLYDTLKGPKRFVTIAGGDHNEPVPADAAAYWKEILTFVASLSAPE